MTYKDKPGYWSNISALQKKQTDKGIENYGQRLEENTNVSIPDRITYLEEELIDGLMYAEWVKEAVTEKDRELQELRRKLDFYEASSQKDAKYRWHFLADDPEDIPEVDEQSIFKSSYRVEVVIKSNQHDWARYVYDRKIWTSPIFVAAWRYVEDPM